MSNTAERYTVAMNSRDLSDESHRIGQLDLIKASGMSKASVALHYLRIISKPSRVDMERMYTALVQYGVVKKLADPQDAALEAMAWLMDQKCKPCQGTGLTAKDGKTYKCLKCKGAMLAKEPSRRDIQFLIDYVMDCKRTHSNNMNKLLQPG